MNSKGVRTIKMSDLVDLSERDRRRVYEAETQPKLIMISNDGECAELSYRATQLSIYLHSLVDEDCAMHAADDPSISSSSSSSSSSSPLTKKNKGTPHCETNLSGELLHKLVCYLEHHCGYAPPMIPFPLQFSQMDKCTNKWDAVFIDSVWKQSKSDVYDLLVESLRLKIEPLFILVCAKIASVIKGQTLREAMRLLRA